MKNNSVRLRLTQTEVARLIESGRVEERIEFGVEPAQQFVYALETAAETEQVRAAIEDNRITIFIPKAQADLWANTSEVGIEADQLLDKDKSLRILIEKDFFCLKPRAGEDAADAFPNPLKDTAC